MARTKVVSSAVPEDIEKWIKSSAKKEGVAPSLWISNLLGYGMMIDAMTKGEMSAIVHELLHLREFINKQLDLNPWNRFLKNHPEGWNEDSKEKDQRLTQKKELS